MRTLMKQLMIWWLPMDFSWPTTFSSPQLHGAQRQSEVHFSRARKPGIPPWISWDHPRGFCDWVTMSPMDLTYVISQSPVFSKGGHHGSPPLNNLWEVMKSWWCQTGPISSWENGHGHWFLGFPPSPEIWLAMYEITIKTTIQITLNIIDIYI